MWRLFQCSRAGRDMCGWWTRHYMAFTNLEENGTHNSTDIYRGLGKQGNTDTTMLVFHIERQWNIVAIGICRRCYWSNQFEVEAWQTVSNDQCKVWLAWSWWKNSVLGSQGVTVKARDLYTPNELLLWSSLPLWTSSPHSSRIPMEVNARFRAHEDLPEERHPLDTDYHAAIGSLMYLAISTRPDIDRI